MVTRCFCPPLFVLKGHPTIGLIDLQIYEQFLLVLLFHLRRHAFSNDPHRWTTVASVVKKLSFVLSPTKVETTPRCEKFLSLPLPFTLYRKIAERKYIISNRTNRRSQLLKNQISIPSFQTSLPKSPSPKPPNFPFSSPPNVPSSSAKNKKKEIVNLFRINLQSPAPTHLYPSPSISNPLSSSNPDLAESKNLNELERSVGPPLHRSTSPYKVNRKKAQGSKERSAFTRFLHHRLFETFRYVHVGMYRAAWKLQRSAAATGCYASAKTLTGNFKDRETGS